MEPFIDGGLFELLIAIGIGYSLNYIFQRKMLLIVYSCVSIIAPGILLFTKSSELYFWSVGISIFNSILLLVLIWKQRINDPKKPLFETKKYIDSYYETVHTLSKKISFKKTKKLGIKKDYIS